MPATERPMLVAGGGPVGCIAALALARQGIPVHVLEAEARVDDSPRAATTHAATLEMLAELGLVDEVIRRGLIEPKFRIWDRASREIIAEFDFGVLKDDHPLSLCGAMRAAQASQHGDRAAAPPRACQSRLFVAGHVPTAVRRPRRRRGRRRAWHSQDQWIIFDRRQWRTFHRAQGARHSVRRLHPSRAFPGVDHAVLFRCRILAMLA